MASYWGKHIHISIFGQSHSAAIGVTIDGLPAGESIDLDALSLFLKRRAPGNSPLSTPRKEADLPEFLCGMVDHTTCGAPLTAIIHNTNTRSQDYSKLKDCPRPAHADYTAHVKYRGYQDVAGGGHFSGRLTAPLCIAGGICLQILSRYGIEIGAHIASVGSVSDIPFCPLGEPDSTFAHLKSSSFPVINKKTETDMKSIIESARNQGDSVGGVVECMATGLPVGLGNPMFEGLESRLASMLFSIPAVKGVEFGAGFESATLFGSQNNDPFYLDGTTVRTRTNHSGGILGGISNGMPLLLRAAFKPTPSISKEQQSISLSQQKNIPLNIVGRHDPCIVPRAVPVVEAAVAIVLLDALLDRNTDQINKIN